MAIGLCVVPQGNAQVATSIRSGPTLPSICTGGTTGESTGIFAVVAGGVSTLDYCSAPNIWSSLSGSGYGTDATLVAGSDPCVKMQTAIYNLPSTGGIVNATKFISITTCSVNPFQAPGQSNPTVFTGIPASGLLLLPDLGIPFDVPFYAPNKWSVQGVPGYGAAPGKTTIQPSTTFISNRPQLSAVGGATGCSATGTSTVTISGTSLPSAANLEGMMVFCSSDASSTAIPDSTTAQIGGCIIAASGNTLTISGAGASGTVTNTGWVITPVIAGWGCGGQSYAVMGSTVSWVTISCQSPSNTYVNPGCIGWLDTSGQESSMLTNFGVSYYDYIGIAVFTSGAQNGGPFGPITLNTKGKSTASTIGVQLFGTGFNAAGGGSSGLCGLLNPCSGTGMRDWIGITNLMDTSGVGIGFDVNAENVRFEGLSHCESVGTCWRIGYSGAASTISINGGAGCSSLNCHNTSVVDISANYANVGVPGPTQNICLYNIQREYATAWDFRDFINLVGDINDAGVGIYCIGASGTANTQIWTNTQPLSNITTGGVVSNDGSVSPNASQVTVSVQNNKYYALGFNNNGTKDVCQQIENAMKFAFNQGLTEGVLIDATGFVAQFGNPCGISPWASGPGTYPYSGKLELSAATYFLSLPWTVPANWILQGNGGNGIGIGGGTGTNLSPNIGNTINANYAVDTVAGTISCTLGSYVCTGVSSNFTSTNLNHFLLACATLPCTTQSAMVGGLITTVGSTTSMTLSSPAQANLSGAAYTITAPMLVNNGIVRDLGDDSNSFATGAFVGLLESGTAGSFVENFSAGHVNAVGIISTGLNAGSMLRGSIQVNGSGQASSIFMCVDAPQGISIMDGLECQSNMVTTPTLSYGVLIGGTGFELNNLGQDGGIQNVNIGVEILVSSTYVTSGILVNGVIGGTGSTAANTLIDLGGITGSNTAPFSAKLFNLLCGGCTTIVNDNLQTYALTDVGLNTYDIGKQVAGCRTFYQDGHTANVPTSSACGNSVVNGTLSVGTGTLPVWSSSAGVPSRACNPGDIDTNTSASSSSTALYICYPANTWLAVTVP